MIQAKLMPWHVAAAVRALFAPAVLALEVQSEFWKTWGAVYRGRQE